MSTEVLAQLPVLGAAWTGDLRTVRTLRFAFGVTLSVAVAYGLAWPLSFITPIFVATLLASPAPRPPLRTGLAIVLTVSGTAALGAGIALTLLPYPPICLLVIGLLLLRIFHAGLGGGNAFANAFGIIGITLIPVIGITSKGLAVAVAGGLATGSGIALALVWLAHTVLADPVRDGTAALSAVPAGPVVIPSERRMPQAWSRLLAVFPVVILFFSFNLSSELIMLIFIALLATSPDLATGLQGGKAMIVGNTIGGICAIAFHQLLIAVPTYAFLLALMLLTTLLLGRQIFSGRPSAPLFATATTALLVLVGSGTLPIGGEVDDKFYLRILLIVAATLYVVGAFALLEGAPRRSRARA